METEIENIDNNNNINVNQMIEEEVEEGEYDGDSTLMAYCNRNFDNTFVTLDQTGISNASCCSILDKTINITLKRRRSHNESIIDLVTTDDEEIGSSEQILDNRKIKSKLLDSILSPAKKKKRKEFTCSTPLNVKRLKTLLTTTEKKKNKMYSKNLYNPNTSVIQEENETSFSTENFKKRIIIVDGSNVGIQHSRNRQLSVRGLEICIKFFEKMGHDIKVILPQYRLQYGKSSNPLKLEDLSREGKIIFTPCKNFGGGKSAISYDDRFILQLAIELDAAIISNDNYRDLVNENAAFKKFIENRVVGFSWCNDLFILPKDPYGKNGPTLDQILNRS